MKGRQGNHRNRLARRLVVTKCAFTAGWVSILVALLGAGQVVKAIPDNAPPKEAEQVATPAPPVAAELVAALAAIPPTGNTDPPLILTYHEISPTEDTPYTLTPTTFAEHMRLLFAAGYRTIRTADLVDWMNGKPLPPKSVFITFDDGTAGVWRHADPILAMYGYTASAFIITSYPGRGPRYMTWPQIVQLAQSGRWDISSHTRAGHRYLSTLGTGAQGAFLTSRAWVEAEQRQESLAEYQDRVTKDLEGSIADLEAHGLPKPPLFSFPFSAATSDEPDITAFLTGLTNRLFAVSMLDDGTGGVTTPEEKARHQLRRLTVLRQFDTARLVTEVTLSSPLLAGGAYSFAVPGAWRANSDVGSFAVDAAGVGLQVPSGGWKYVEYMPPRTVFWQDYSVAAKVTGLDTASDTSAGVSLWTGSSSQITVSVSAGWLHVKAGTPAATVYEGHTGRINNRHSLVVSVAGGRLSVIVDGVAVVKNRAVPPGYGGVGLFGSARNKPASIRFIDGRMGPPRPVK